VLRERQMEQRKARILDAAARLLRETGGTDFSMVALAEAAEVSPKTPYNLFRSKPALLYALLNRTLDQMIEEALAFSTSDPWDRVLEAAGIMAGVITRDPAFMKPLYQFLIGVRDAEHRPHFMERGIAFWTSALDAAVARKLLTAARAEQLAREFLIHNIGATELWIHDEIDDVGFRAQVAYGAAVLLSQAAPDAEKSRLQRRVRAAEKRLAPRFALAGTRDSEERRRSRVRR
jgi:AcrR family transcriptional regulator